jgi:hypothetical protein
MKVNGAYKFRTKANIFPSLKICFLGQYQDRVSGDTNFSFFIATPDNEVEEVVIDNPYSGDFFIPKIEEVYLQNVGNKKTDWVATFKCTWVTSLNEQEGDIKVLLGYKAGETVTNEKPKEYIAVETDPKYLVDTIAQRKHGALHAIGGGFFTGFSPVSWYKYKITATSESSDDETTATGGQSTIISGPINDQTVISTANTTNSGKTYPFYYYDNNGLTEQRIKPDYSATGQWTSITTGQNRSSTVWLDGSSTLNFSFSGSNIVSLYSNEDLSQGSVSIPPYLNPGDADYFYYLGPYIDFYSEAGFIKRKSWISPSVSFISDISASHSILGNFATTEVNYEGSLSGLYSSSANWHINKYSTFLARNLTHSFVFKSEETAIYSATESTVFNAISRQPVISGNTSITRNYKTSVYLTSLSLGEEEFVCEFVDTAKTSEEDEYERIASYWGKYNARPLYAWDYYNVVYSDATYSHQCIGNYYIEPIIIEDETPINIFMKAVSQRGKSALRGDYLYYIESDVASFGDHIPYVESDAFTPNINGFLTKEFTLSVLVFNLKDIENYEKKEVKFKPAKLPEGMENLTISKILAIQYIE